MLRYSGATTQGLRMMMTIIVLYWPLGNGAAASDTCANDCGGCQTVTYRKQASGTCASHGMLAITTIAECDAAAAALSNADVSSTPTSMTPRPEGCYDNGDGLWLATNEANAGKGPGGGEEQICSLHHGFTGDHAKQSACPPPLRCHLGSLGGSLAGRPKLMVCSIQNM